MVRLRLHFCSSSKVSVWIAFENSQTFVFWSSVLCFLSCWCVSLGWWSWVWLPLKCIVKCILTAGACSADSQHYGPVVKGPKQLESFYFEIAAEKKICTYILYLVCPMLCFFWWWVNDGVTLEVSSHSGLLISALMLVNCNFSLNKKRLHCVLIPVVVTVQHVINVNRLSVMWCWTYQSSHFQGLVAVTVSRARSMRWSEIILWQATAEETEEESTEMIKNALKYREVIDIHIIC